MPDALVDEFTATVWRYDGQAAWYFLTLPVDLSEEIRARTERVGFGSVRVDVRIGATSWSTSVFPDKESGSFVLPVKAAVRRAEDLDDGSTALVHLTVPI
ncbi:MAG: DUF1905 domain-containing protein [Candidatus Nanopelagicales bacterium]